jgi:arylformamidase
MDQPKPNRRLLMAAGVAGALALAQEPARAQRCPAPPRPKGPPVWLDLDQQELDDAYDQSVYAFNRANIEERDVDANAAALERIGPPERRAYGAAEIEKVAIWRTQSAGAPSLIFLHGGAWRGGSALRSAARAEMVIKAGANLIVPDFDSVGQTGGELTNMVDQCRRAAAWVYRNAREFGGDPERLYLCGHSSGAHLGGCVVITDWQAEGLPLDIFKGALLGSGMYELKPVALSKRSAYVHFTPEIEEALSPQRHLDRVHTPLVLTYGSLETPEFQRQSRDFAAALSQAGKSVRLIVGKGYNHYETEETLGNPYRFMGRAVLELMNVAV